MTKVIPFREGHLDLIDPLDCYDEGAIERASQLVSSSYLLAYTLVAHKRPIAVLGCIKDNAVLHIWAIAGKEIKQFPKFYHKTVKDLIQSHVDELGIKRVQSIIDVDNLAAIDQHLHLGFEVEAKLKRSGPNGGDQYIFRRLI